MDRVKKIFVFCVIASVVVMLFTACESQGKDICLKEMESTPVLMRLYKYVIGDDVTCESWFQNLQTGALQIHQPSYMDIEYISIILFAVSFKMFTKKRTRLVMDKRTITLKTAAHSSKRGKHNLQRAKYHALKYPGGNIFQNELRRFLISQEIEKYRPDKPKGQEQAASVTLVLQEERVNTEPTERLSWLDMTTMPIPDEFWEEILDFS